MTEPMTTERLASLMGQPIYDPDIVDILIEGLENGTVPTPELKLLETAGYVTYDAAAGTFHITMAARDLLEGVPEWTAAVVRAGQRFRARRRQAIRRRLEEAQ